MTVFVMIALGRCCSGPVLRRSWLGLGGVGTVVAAGLSAYGFNSAFGKILAAFSDFSLLGAWLDNMVFTIVYLMNAPS